MRKYFLISLLICGLVVSGGSAWSYTLDGGAIDVGNLDVIIAKAELTNSADATELAWLQGVPGLTTPITWETKYDGSASVWNWEETDQDSGVYALKLSFSPEYFLIKTGNLKLSPVNYEHFLFQNNTETLWAVVRLSDLGAMPKNTNIEKFSHIVELNGSTTTSVPEPTTLLLLGLGLIGVAGVKRKFKK